MTYGLDPAASDPEGDAQRDAAIRFDAMSVDEIVSLANEALDADDHASAVWPLRHKLCAHLAEQIKRGEA